MNIFKKFFSIFKKKEKAEKEECWYNNAHEGSLGHSEVLPGDNSMECTVAMDIAQNWYRLKGKMYDKEVRYEHFQEDFR